MKKVNFSPVTCTKRVIAFAIDIFIIQFTRGLLFQVMSFYWLQKHAINLLSEFKFVFRHELDLRQLTYSQVEFIQQHAFFSRFLIVIGVVMLVGFVYNLITLSTKWSATVGQKIVGFYIISSKKEKKLTRSKALLRSVLVSIPLGVSAVLIMLAIAGNWGLGPQISPPMLILSVGFILLCWYDMFFFTKDKLLMHDLLSSTRAVVEVKEEDFVEKTLNFIDSLVSKSFKMVKKAWKKRKKEEEKEVKAKPKRKVKRKTKGKKKGGKRK